MNYNWIDIHLTAPILLIESSNPGVGTPLFGLYGDVPLDRVWLFGVAGI